ncbi:MAG: DUF3106 domain-containing protein [Burkholderiaceae bacterium]|jgi:hypothetical protein|nr:DUF3106 domain-containing protein [Burkholderiaceae bacterium]
MTAWFSRRVCLFLVVVIAFFALAAIGLNVRSTNTGADSGFMEWFGFVPGEKQGKKPTHPYWRELTQAQRDLLAPLEKDWNVIPAPRKKKWLELAEKMEQMPQEERQRLQGRLKEWVNMTPEERQEVRRNYLEMKEQHLRNKSEAWQAYQELPEAEKKKYQARARRKPSAQPIEHTSADNAPTSPASPTAPDAPGQGESPEYWR